MVSARLGERLELVLEGGPTSKTVRLVDDKGVEFRIVQYTHRTSQRGDGEIRTTHRAKGLKTHRTQKQAQSDRHVAPESA